MPCLILSDITAALTVRLPQKAISEIESKNNTTLNTKITPTGQKWSMPYMLIRIFRLLS